MNKLLPLSPKFGIGAFLTYVNNRAFSLFIDL